MTPNKKSAESDAFSDELRKILDMDDIQDNVVRLKPPAADQTKKPRYQLGVQTFKELCEQWVYIAPLDRFYERDSSYLYEGVGTIKQLGGITDNVMIKPHVFDSLYAYAKIHPTKSVSKSMFERAIKTVRRMKRVVYKPGEPEFPNAETYNFYRPSDVVPTQGETKLWDSHLKYLFPDQADRDAVLNWIAWLLQNLDKKPKHALLIAGEIQGTGKSFIAEVLARILGLRNVSPVGASELSSSFNKWALESKLILIEELRALESRSMAQNLHALITQERIPINDKGVPTFNIENCFGVLGMTNSDTPIKLDNTDRRYLIVRTFAEPKGAAYYAKLYASLDDPAFVASVAYALLSRDLGEYDGRGRAPATKAKQEMIDAAANDWAKWMLANEGEAVLSGNTFRRDSIVEAMPRHLQRNGVESGVDAALKTYFQAKPWPNQIRDARGGKVRVWVRTPKGKKWSHAEVQAAYRSERAAERKAADGRVADDFDWE
jgi:hypothetical protein